jgi:hypothetical protein
MRLDHDRSLLQMMGKMGVPNAEMGAIGPPICRRRTRDTAGDGRDLIGGT